LQTKKIQTHGQRYNYFWTSSLWRGGRQVQHRSASIALSKQGYTKEFLDGTNYILPLDLNKYLDMGFHHFKIQGRELPPSQLFSASC
jgi:collagenase-like PrtC family protease